MNMDFMKDNEYKYENIENFNDNMEDDIVIIAHKIFNIINDNYIDNGDVGDDNFMKQVESYMCENQYDSDTINEVKRIIDEEYLAIL